MKLKNYVYTGPDSGISIQTAAAVAATDKAPEEPAKVLDVVLRDGQEVELPQDNDAVKTLEAKGFLKAVDDTAPAANTSAVAVTDVGAAKAAGKK